MSSEDRFHVRNQIKVSTPPRPAHSRLSEAAWGQYQVKGITGETVSTVNLCECCFPSPGLFILGGKIDLKFTKAETLW